MSTIPFSLLDTETLLGVFEYTLPVSSYWRDLCFRAAPVQSEDQYIDMEKVVRGRKLAPFVTPMTEGKPIYTETGEVARFQTAYMKAKDVVDATRVLKRRPGMVFKQQKESNQSRFDALISDIAQEHRNTFERRWEWLAAKAAIDGKVVLSGEDYPTRLLDFNRDPANTVVLAGAAKWNGASANIIGNINQWRSLVRRNRKGGGPTNRLTVGANVWEVMSKDAEILERLSTLTIGNVGTNDLNVGLREGERVEFMGKIGTLEIWVYSETYDLNGVEVDYMSQNDIVLTGPNVGGVPCFGAILDKGASFQALPLFPKMWNEEDPSATQFMSQSAPLFIPVNANNTFKATVL